MAGSDIAAKGKAAAGDDSGPDNYVKIYLPANPGQVSGKLRRGSGGRQPDNGQPRAFTGERDAFIYGYFSTGPAWTTSFLAMKSSICSFV